MERRKRAESFERTKLGLSKLTVPGVCLPVVVVLAFAEASSSDVMI